MAGRDAELDAIVDTIRTARGDEVHRAIERGIALTEFPCNRRPILLASELTPEQRRLMEAVATRSGLEERFVWERGIPDPVQVRRRWLGLDPPGPLEKIVSIVTASGETVAVPRWRALQRGVLATPRDDALRGLVPEPFERLQLVVGACEGDRPPYDIWFNPRPEYQRVGRFVIDDTAREWATETFARLVEAWHALDEDGASADEEAHATPPAGPGWATHETRSYLNRAVLRQLMVVLVRSGVWPAFDERFHGLIELDTRCSWELIAAVREAHRDEVLVDASEREHPGHALDLGLRALRHFASRPLADALADHLESDAFQAEESAIERRRRQRQWEKLRRKLPAGVARPLAARTLVEPVAARPPDQLPEATPGPLRALPREELARQALADVAVFVTLAVPGRLAVAAQVAHELGSEFEPLAELVGDRRLAAIRHVASGYELVLLPGETFEMGLTDHDVACIEQCGLRESTSPEDALSRMRVASRPTRVIAAPPIAFGRDVVQGEVERAFVAAHGPHEAGIVAAEGFADRCGFSLPSEAEWERAARDAEAATFVADSAASWFRARPQSFHTRAGIGGMHVGEWVADRWQPTFEGAAATMAPRRDEANPVGVFRGLRQGYTDTVWWNVVQALAAMRKPGTMRYPMGVEPLRFVLRPGPDGRFGPRP